MPATMQLRSILLGNGNYRLSALSSDDGSNAVLDYLRTDAPGGLETQAAIAGRIAANSNGGIEYDSENHDPFE